MRILLSSVVLALSISFACDQPHEEVGGYKIGCPLDDPTNYELIFESAEAKEYEGRANGFFDIVVLGVINENIEVVKLRRHDERNVSQHEIDSMLSALIKRWGTPYDRDEILPYMYLWKFKSGIVDNIAFSSSEANADYPFFSIIYVSKKAKALQDEIDKNEKDALTKELSKY